MDSTRDGLVLMLNYLVDEFGNSGRDPLISAGTAALERPQISRDWREWTPIVIWAIVMFIFSTSGFSANNTSKIIGPLLRWFIPGVSSVSITLVNLLLRKFAHFVEYGVFFWLLIRGPLKGRPLLAMGVCILYAASDEAHQIFVPGRGPSIYDVALDSTGAAFSGFLRAALTEII